MSATTTDFLIVDDDPTLAGMLERVLQRRGFSTKSGSDAAQALQLISNTQFARAIVDLKLGNDSGLQLIRELKLRQPNIAIVMLTGYSSISTAVEAVKLGAVNYLCKPADADEILAAFGEQKLSAVSEANYTPLSIDRLEWEHIQKILQENDGNISATARALGMHRRTLQRKLHKRPVKQ
ncbi:response regulator transcription factor [Cellvibrio sp. OA-2007]|uniref:response regulator transcription factor n=1 Tax=Cellvibrio sp. OA-2007 TaxID=529823 RepID=UPI0007828553|nr:response regulator transcription factor [Cellvibrio sp. OA-2007]